MSEMPPAVPDRNLPLYAVTADWADLAAVPGAESSWAHHGLAATAAGELVGFHAGQLVTFDKHGHVVRIATVGLTEGHGITLVREDGQEYLWVADPGFTVGSNAEDATEGVLRPDWGKGLHRATDRPRVVKLTLDGRLILELPEQPADTRLLPGPLGPYRPCGTAVNETRFGGTGDIWVADGYGSSLVHRFDSSGWHASQLSGEEGAGRFDCPHAVFIDRRRGKAPELYIADRGNARVQVYDLDGRYRRSFGDGFLSSPSGFVQWGDELVVAELFGRLAVLDEADELIGYIGFDETAMSRPGWPNALADNGGAQAPQLTDGGRFNSPHSMAVDAAGNLYIAEWLIGGRYTRLAPR
jgi:hypothetical protein